MSEDHKTGDSLVNLYHEGMTAASLGALAPADFSRLQKDVLRQAMAMLKAAPSAKADYVIGLIGLTDGDRVGLPPENAVAHLIRSYHAGNPEAGIYLSYLCFGQYSYMPERFVNRPEGVTILSELAKGGHIHARYELAHFYLLQIMEANDSGRAVPDEWYARAWKHAQAAADAHYSGGHYLLGHMYASGVNVQADPAAAHAHYTRALETAGTYYFETAIRADTCFNLASMMFNGEGIPRDRPKALALMTEAARLGHWLAREWLEDNAAMLEKDGITPASGESVYDASIINADEFIGADAEPESEE